VDITLEFGVWSIYGLLKVQCINLWIRNVLDSVYRGFNWIFKWNSL